MSKFRREAENVIRYLLGDNSNYSWESLRMEPAHRYSTISQISIILTATLTAPPDAILRAFDSWEKSIKNLYEAFKWEELGEELDLLRYLREVYKDEYLRDNGILADYKGRFNYPGSDSLLN